MDASVTLKLTVQELDTLRDALKLATAASVSHARIVEHGKLSFQMGLSPKEQLAYERATKRFVAIGSKLS